MISTITTSTVSTVTTMAIAGSLGLIGVLVLLILVVQKEIATSSESKRLKALGQLLNIGIAPLLIGFGLIVLSRLSEVLK